MLSNLRHLLGPLIEVTRQTAGLAATALGAADSRRFEDCVAAAQRQPAGAAQALREAAALYRGDLLEGFTIADAPSRVARCRIARGDRHNLDERGRSPSWIALAVIAVLAGRGSSAVCPLQAPLQPAPTVGPPLLSNAMNSRPAAPVYLRLPMFTELFTVIYPAVHPQLV